MEQKGYYGANTEKSNYQNMTALQLNNCIPFFISEKALDSPEESMTELGLDGNLRYTGDGMEDMSLSSASSLERNDTSEEFLDDFDNLGDQLQIGIPQNKYPVATPTQTRLQGLLNETMYWTRIGLTGIAKCYSSNSCVYVTNSTMLI